MEARIPGDEQLYGPDDTGAAAESLESLKALLLRRVTNMLDLAADEFRLASLSALGMLMMLVVGTASIVIGWGLVVAAIIFALVSAGAQWVLVVGGFAAFHAGLAIVCWQLLVRLSRNLSLPALRAAIGEHAGPPQ